MARRRRKKSLEASQKRPLKKRKSQRTKSILWIGGLVLAGVMLFLLSEDTRSLVTGSKKSKSFYVLGGETRPVLDPLLFTGMARAAYAAAEKYPEVMDQVYCYCKCDMPPFNHRSLLSCFVDRHGED